MNLNDVFSGWMQQRNNPSSLSNLLFGGVGLTGLDPKFIQDPRFNYWTRMEYNPQIFPPNLPPAEGGGGWGVIFSPPGSRDPMDTAPVGVKSTLNIDLPDERLAKAPGYVGPNPAFLAAARSINPTNQPWTHEQLNALRQWIMNQRNLILDAY